MPVPLSLAQIHLAVSIWRRKFKDHALKFFGNADGDQVAVFRPNDLHANGQAVFVQARRNHR